MYRIDRTVLAIAALAVLTACNNMQVRTPSATARLAPTRGSSVEGSVSFLQKGEKVMVEAKITGLTPGLHGFHIHEKGDCSAPDASSAGPHFNPQKTSHGGPAGTERHSGDLGNIIADNAGVAILKSEVDGITLGTGENSIIGRAVVVHASVDDFVTQPAGNAGPRVACGLISLSPDKWFHTPQ